VVAEAESPAIGVRCRFHWGCAAAGVYGRLPVTAWRETGIGHYRVFALSEPQGEEEVRSQSALEEAGGSSSEPLPRGLGKTLQIRVRHR
jgi:hypothetical protein